jgi:hypothetical protein
MPPPPFTRGSSAHADTHAAQRGRQCSAHAIATVAFHATQHSGASPPTEPARSSFRPGLHPQARDHARTPRTRAHPPDAYRALVWDRRSSRHFRVTSRCRSLAAWIPDWLVTPTSPVGSQRTGGHVAADVGITTTSALIASCRRRHDAMFSTARSASSVSASRTTTGTSARPSERAAAIRWKPATSSKLSPSRRTTTGKSRDADLLERDLAPSVLGDCGKRGRG